MHSHGGLLPVVLRHRLNLPGVVGVVLAEDDGELATTQSEPRHSAQARVGFEAAFLQREHGLRKRFFAEVIVQSAGGYAIDQRAHRTYSSMYA